MSRIILFTGKGGVGKTTIAAATALHAAELGYNTLVLSTDSAHSLGDSFDLGLRPEPTEIRPNLWAQESDILYNIEKHWGRVQQWLSALMAWRGVDDIVAEEIAVLPGMEELANLMWVHQHHDSGQYQVIVVDCAPTADTLRLLSFPEVAQWWLHKLLPVGRRLYPLATPLVRRFTDMPLPDDEIFSAADDLVDQLSQLHSLLADPRLTVVRLVLTPERMVIKEAQRTYTYLNLYGYFTDAVICNRLIPDEADGRYWQEWKRAQTGQLGFIEECFSPLPILTVPLMEREVVGEAALRQLGGLLYGNGDPTQPLFEGRAITIGKENDSYVLTLELPFVTKGNISLMKSGDELVVRIGNRRRNIILPQVLLGLEPRGAKLEEGRLHITFGESKTPSAGG